MYDNVKIWLGLDKVDGGLSTLPNFLDNAITLVDEKTGGITTHGNIGNIQVKIKVGGVWLVGSLAKFMFGGSNIYTLDRHTTADVIEKLSDTLHLPISDGEIKMLEFGTNFLMKHPVTAYIHRLGIMPRRNRVSWNERTLYYKGKNKRSNEDKFYDKIADAKKKKMSYPDDWEHENVLRYEMRLNSGINRQLRADVTASILSDAQFYRMMVKRYQNNYFSISKIKQLKPDVMSKIKTPKDALNVLFAILMSHTSQSQIEGFLEGLKEAQTFKDRASYYRLRKQIYDTLEKADMTDNDELIKELDNDINNCGAYA